MPRWSQGVLAAPGLLITLACGAEMAEDEGLSSNPPGTRFISKKVSGQGSGRGGWV